MIIILATYFYVLPTQIAWVRSHRQLTAIFALNILLGWTVIGWLGALVWAFIKERSHEDIYKDWRGQG